MKQEFRAWYKPLSIMCQVAAINFYYGNVVLLAVNENQINLFEEMNKKASIDCKDRISVPDKEAILMRYTGLKDKNGKEIYEGDICIVNLSYFKIKDEEATVIFHNGAFQFQYGCEKFFSKPHDAWDEVEVIGNIYDNPELLQEVE